jgi:malate dehydrogenase
MGVVGEQDVRAAVAQGRRRLSVPAEALVTPQALEVAERLGVTVVHGPDEPPALPTVDPALVLQRTLLRRSPRWVAAAPRRGAAPSRFTRVAFVGAGAVGATTAHLTAMADVADEIVLIDVVPGIAAATGLDIEHASGITRSPTRARGGTSLSLVAGADVVVVTAGRPRTPA